MTVLVDTDVFSFLWQDRPEAAIYRPLVADQIVALSFTSIGELYFGAVSRGWRGRRIEELEGAIRPYLILPYNIELSRHWGRLKADTRRQGRPTPDNDLWIAAAALHYQIPLATNNRRHFEHIDGLVLLPRREES